MNMIHYALFSLEELDVIANSQRSENDQLRPLNDTAVAVLSRDMAKHGFDHSKQGEMLISVFSHHLNMFPSIALKDLQDKNILNLSKAMLENMKTFNKFAGTQDALKEMVFTDGRHRHKVARMAFPGERTLLLCKILLDVSQKEGRVISYNASRQAEGVAPCFVDAMKCLFSEELDVEGKRDIADRIGCQQHLNELNVLHSSLYNETEMFIQRWRVTRLFSIENIFMRKNKNFMRLLNGIQPMPLRRRGRPNVLCEYFRGGALSKSDRAHYQVLVLAVIVSVFQLSESEAGTKLQLGEIVSKSSNTFIQQLEALVPNMENKRLLCLKSSRELLICLWKAGMLSLANIHNVDEGACHRQLEAVLQSAKDIEVPKVPLKEVHDSKGLFSSLKATKPKSPSFQDEKALVLLREEPAKSLEKSELKSEQDVIPVAGTVKTPAPELASQQEVNISAPPESPEAQPAQQPGTPDLGSELDCIESPPKSPEDTTAATNTKKTDTKKLEALGTVLKNVQVFPTANKSVDDMEFKRTPYMEEDTDDDALDIIPKVDMSHEKKSLPTQDKKSVFASKDDGEKSSSDVVFVQSSSPKMQTKKSSSFVDTSGPRMAKVRRSSRRSTMKPKKFEESDLDTPQSEENESSFLAIPKKRKKSPEATLKEELPSSKRHKGLKAHEKAIEAKVACAKLCFAAAENIVERIEILQVQPTGEKILPTLTKCSEHGMKWAVFANAVDSLFDQSILDVRSLVSLLKEFEDNNYHIKDVFVLSQRYIEDLPTTLGNNKLQVVTQKVFLSNEWSSKISEIPAMAQGHFIHYGRGKTKQKTPEVTCVRLERNLGSEDFRSYITGALENMKGVHGIIDALDEQTELVEAVIAQKDLKQVLKLNEFSHSGKKSSCTYIYAALRKHVMKMCTCGGHAILHEGNMGRFNMHPMKNVKLCDGVSKPFQMVLSEKDKFFSITPVSHYSLYLHDKQDTSGWSCDKTHMEDGSRLEQGGFLSFEDYQKCIKGTTKELKLVAGKSYIVDCESAMRDHKARLSPFHLRPHYVSGLFEKEWFLFFDDDSMASKFNQHDDVNMVEYSNEVTAENLRTIFERGFEHIRESHMIIPTLKVETLKSLGRKSSQLQQCRKCKAIELFVNYGANYVFED